MRLTFKKLVPLSFLLAIPIACTEAPLNDLKKGAQEAIEDAKVKAKEWQELSEEELQRI